MNEDFLEIRPPINFFPSIPVRLKQTVFHLLFCPLSVFHISTGFRLKPSKNVNKFIFCSGLVNSLSWFCQQGLWMVLLSKHCISLWFLKSFITIYVSIVVCLCSVCSFKVISSQWWTFGHCKVKYLQPRWITPSEIFKIQKPNSIIIL